MPYKKKIMRKKRVSRRRNYRSRPLIPLPEKKSVVDTVANQDIEAATSGYTIGPSFVGQGVGQHNRIGNRINITGIYSKYFITAPYNLALSQYETANVRVILYRPKDPNALLDATFNQVVDKDKYNVIMDKFYSLGGFGPSTRAISIRRKFRNMPVHYDGPGGGDYSDKPLYLYFVSDSFVGPHPKLNGQMSCYFYDN